MSKNTAFANPGRWHKYKCVRMLTIVRNDYYNSRILIANAIREQALPQTLPLGGTTKVSF